MLFIQSHKCVLKPDNQNGKKYRSALHGQVPKNSPRLNDDVIAMGWGGGGLYLQFGFGQLIDVAW